MEEKLILEKVRTGDEIAFASLYDCYWRKVYNFSKLYIISSSDVSEVVQDVFLKVWESKENIDVEKSIDGLLFIITRNIILNYSRKSFYEAQLKMTVQQGLQKSELSYSIDEELEASDLKTHIDKLIAMLPIQRQMIYRMSREEHLSHKEIADRCHVSEKAIERQITLALKFIKDNLPLVLILFRY